jgi:hypothetical protein
MQSNTTLSTLILSAHAGSSSPLACLSWMVRGTRLMLHACGYAYACRYYLFDPNASAKRWGGMGDMYYMDELAGPARVQGPWADVWAATMSKRFDAWFGELKRLGAAVDLVLCDFEMGGESDSYNWAHQPTADGSDPTVALQSDARWPALRAELNAVGKPYGVTFEEDDMSAMAEWTVRDWRMHVWGDVVVSRYVASHLNASVFDPIRAHFPSVRFSNFAHGHHTDPSGVATPSSRNSLWAGDAVIGLGAHVGTHQSRGFYGSVNTTRVLASQTPGPLGVQSEVAGTSFDALVNIVVVARDMVRAAPTVPVHPWLAPKHADWGSGFSYLSSGNHTTDEVMMWEENVFHLALSTGAAEFLWWQPGSQKPEGEGQPLLSRALAELDEVTGLAAHGGSDSCSVRPLDTNTTAINTFSVTSIMSAASVSCSDGFTRDVFRFTPRCTRTVWCTWWGSSDYPPRNGTKSPQWRTGSGWDVTPVPDGVVWLAQDPVSTAGAWLVRDAGS